MSVLTVATSTMLLQMEEFGIKHQYAANTRLSKAMKLLRLLCLLKNASGLRSSPTHLTGRDPLEHPVFAPKSQTRVSRSPRTPNCWVALQESAVFLQHEDVPRKFHVVHFRGCPTLFDKHTFEPNLSVESIKKRQVEFHNYVAALPQRSGKQHCVKCTTCGPYCYDTGRRRQGCKRLQ